MLHPHTELKFVSEEIGYGIFATEDIPAGTITWVRDELDRVFSPGEMKKLSKPNYENLLKYTYRNAEGNYFFCWDLTKFINHSFEPNSILTSLGFEIAIKDIKKGDELTNDYGTLNIIEAFSCAKGPHGRGQVKPDDLKWHHKEWDFRIAENFSKILEVAQPLRIFLSDDELLRIKNIVFGEEKIPSILENYFNQEAFLSSSPS